MLYRDFEIEHSYYGTGYQYQHMEIDGAPDSGDKRYGSGDSIEDCKEQIDDYYREKTFYHVVTAKTITKFDWLSDAMNFINHFGGQLVRIVDGSEQEFNAV